MKFTKAEITKNTTLEEVLEFVLENKCAGLAASTTKGHRKKGNQLIGWIGSVKVGDFNEINWQKLEAHLHEKYARSTINGFMELVRPTVILLLNEGHLNYNPLSGKKPPRATKGAKKVFKKADIRKLIVVESPFESEILLVQFGLLTGLRIGELLALNKEGYDEENKTYFVDLTLSTQEYRVVKTKSSERYVDLSKNAVSVIKKLIKLAENRGKEHIDVRQADNRTMVRYERTMLAFNSSRNKTFSHVDHFADDFFREFCQKRGVEYIAPSHFRHTFASQMITKGVAIGWIAKQMGHTTKDMIEKHYGCWIKEDAQENELKVNECIDEMFEVLNESANDDYYAQDEIYKVSIFSRFRNFIKRLAG